MLKKSLWLGLLLTAVPVFSLVADFKSERIHITIGPQQVTVEGHYWFKARTTPARLSILYPFPEGCYPDSIRIEFKDSNMVFQKARRQCGIMFDLILIDTLPTVCKVWYRQRLRQCNFTYILTSTREWDNPLDSAEFEIDIPYSYNKQILSYQPDTVSINEGYARYYLKKYRFWPEKDLILSWE